MAIRVLVFVMAALSGWSVSLPVSADGAVSGMQLAFNNYGSGKGQKKRGMKGRKKQVARKSYKKGCRAVCSSYGSKKRCDGSTRSRRYPIHGGVDMAVSVGTPLIAVADGEVVENGRGGSIGGIVLAIRHPPEATGLKAYYFSRYLHLNKRSPFKVGAKVSKGQQIASSGKSGTVGSFYYGAKGFAHLHYEVRKGKTSSWSKAKRTNPLAFLKAAGSNATWPCR